MGIVTKRVDGELRVGGTLSVRIKRKGKKQFEKPIILKGKDKNDRSKT